MKGPFVEGDERRWREGRKIPLNIFAKRWGMVSD